MHPKHTEQPVTFPQRALVVATIMLACCAVSFADQLRSTLVPEHMAGMLDRVISEQMYANISEEALQVGHDLIIEQAAMPPLNGEATLVVGDSMVIGWPWQADVIARQGTGTRAVLAELRALPSTVHYEQMVLWTGTIDMVQTDTQQYVAAVRELVAFAQTMADDVIVIGPMPVSHGRGTWWGAQRGGMDNRAPVHSAMALLAKAQLDAEIVDACTWREETMNSGMIDVMTRDRVHLSRYGFLALAKELGRTRLQLTARHQPGVDLPITNSI